MNDILAAVDAVSDGCAGGGADVDATAVAAFPFA